MKIIKGDIVKEFKKSQYKYLLHQVNCFGLAGGVHGVIHREFGVKAQPDLKGLGKCQWDELNNRGKTIVHLMGQYSTGHCNKFGLDCLPVRNGALVSALMQFELEIWDGKSEIIIPLIASGLASDLDIKQDMSDMEYFELIVWPLFTDKLKEKITVCVL